MDVAIVIAMVGHARGVCDESVHPAQNGGQRVGASVVEILLVLA